MGYETTHSIKVHIGNESDIITAIMSQTNYHSNTLFTHRCKWYTRKDDCLRVSNRFSDAIFSIYGYGEDEGDLWREDYHAGKLVGNWKFDGIPDMDVQMYKKFHVNKEVADRLREQLKQTYKKYDVNREV
jgi:hypothetical protein